MPPTYYTFGGILARRTFSLAATEKSSVTS